MLWIRDIDVLAGQKKFTSLENNALTIEFNIPFSDGNEPDLSEVKIYNLSDGTIADIKKDGYIFVNAGYVEENNKANILTGQIEDISTEWQNLDKITTFKISDGAKTWRNAELNKTYKENTKASYIMRDLANILSYEIVAIEPVEDKVYKLGKTIKGKASESLKQLVKDTKSKMFVNKNRIVIRGQNVGYETGFILRHNTGLIGLPVLNKDNSGDKTSDVKTDKERKNNKETKTYWTVTSLLNPRIETDSILKIESKTLNATVRVISGVHKCDANEFYTEVKVEEI